jgi:SAM-dependent methyltransferase
VVEPGASNPWLAGDGQRGREYDQRFEALAAQGTAVHGEADLVASLTRGSVLDAGCGTGRVAIELAGRGFDVVGVDLDPSMLEVARAKAPSLRWVQADLAQLALGRTFDAVVLAGNVMIFVTPGTEGAVLTALSAHLRPGGLLVAGFSLGPPRLELSAYDRLAGAAGLVLEHRWATWDRTPYRTGDDYAVSVHVKDAGPVPNVDGPDR